MIVLGLSGGRWLSPNERRNSLRPTLAGRTVDGTMNLRAACICYTIGCLLLGTEICKDRSSARIESNSWNADAGEGARADGQFMSPHMKRDNATEIENFSHRAEKEENKNCGKRHPRGIQFAGGSGARL